MLRLVITEGRGFEVAGDAGPGGGAPIFGDVFFGGPVADGHEEPLGEGVGVGLVEAAKLGKALVVLLHNFLRAVRAALNEAGGGEKFAQFSKFGGREAFAVEGTRRRVENLGQVDEGVARHGESEFGLPFERAFAIGDENRGNVENGGESGEPGLIIVLRTKIAEHGIGEMALH